MTTKVKEKVLNTSITAKLTVFTYRHEHAREELRQCETNAQCERFVATRVKFETVKKK